MPTSPYTSALQVDPAREQAELVKLKKDPQKLASLGLSPDEDFTQLKSDPVKYNKVLSYVKGQAYGNPAYQAVASGTTKPEFVQGQMGDYSKNTFERAQTRNPELQKEYGVPEAQKTYQDLSAGEAAAPTQIREKLVKEGGYDIPALTDNYERNRTAYADAYRRFVAGEISSADYAAASRAVTESARTLDKAQKELGSKTEAGVGAYKTNVATAKNAFDNAYSRYKDALTLDSQGYSEARGEKLKAAEDMFTEAKNLVEEEKKARDKYQGAQGKIFNPYTGKYETKPGSGNGANSKVFAEADKLRKDLADGTLDWGQAYGRLKAQFPTADSKTLDAALGGSAGFDAKTGTFDQTKATGFARQGQRGKTDKNVARTNAYAQLDTDIANMPPDVSPNEAYNLFLQAYGNELSDAEIKAALAAKGIYL